MDFTKIIEDLLNEHEVMFEHSYYLDTLSKIERDFDDLKGYKKAKKVFY